MIKTVAYSVLAGLGIFFIFFILREDNPPSYIAILPGEKEDNPSGEFSRAIEEEEELLKDPRTGKIPTGIRELELNQAREIYRQQLASAPLFKMNAAAYTFQGPSNLGGRTRALAFDISDASSQTMIAGSVSGGVFKTINGGISWTRVSPNNQLFSITAIAQDPRPGFQSTWYYGGGEGSGNSAGEAGASYRGDGIYKSTDNGNTWTKLASSNTGSLYSFDNRADYMYNISVNPLNGDVYLACANTIRRSQDGGVTWTDVISGASFSSNSWTDVQITSTGRIYVAFSGTNTGSTLDGVWTSVTGNAGSFTQIAGSALAAPAGWNSYGGYGRVVLAISPSSENLVYAMYYKGVTSNCTTPTPEVELYRYDQSASTWSDLSSSLPDEAGCLSGNDPFAVQGGYDMALAVKPDDANTLVIGGTNAYRSLNGGTSWTRIGGYAGPSSYSQWANHHPDIHVLKFIPADPNQLVSGNDGGIQKGNITASPVVWTPMNNNYQTYQYYHVAIKQETGANDFIGGAQDNGTSAGLSGSTSFSNIISGDGVAVGLGSGAGSYKQYCGAQNGTIYRRNASQSPGFIEANLTPSGVTSIFVTYFLLDPDNTQYLYYAGQAGGSNKLLRITNASTAGSSSWQTFDFNFTGYIRSMSATRGSYTASSRLYLGTDAGRVYRLDDPANTALNALPIDITPSGMAGMGTVIGITTNPENHNEVLVVYSNYGTTNIWYTSNAEDASPVWTNSEGNLTLPSIRSAMILKSGSTVEYYVGTSVGLFKTTEMNGGSTVWTQEAVSEIGNAVVTSLSLRPSDNNFAIGTHGSGMWKGVVATPLPVHILSFSGSLVGNSARLNWTTSSETDNTGFEIERSYDGLQYKKTGYVKGAGNSSVPTSYSFDDRDIAQEYNYYRLRQLNSDGQGIYSDVILVRNRLNTASSIRILKNPFGNYLDMQLPGRQTSQLYIRLIDMNGRLVNEQMLNSNLTRIRVELNGVKIIRGTYLLQVIDGPKLYSAKVVRE